ncbi:MAG: ABC transporter permease [Spirochaetales bacterium]|nr:ABC transporter permease [Spirochaetales bacterium]
MPGKGEENSSRFNRNRQSMLGRFYDKAGIYVIAGILLVIGVFVSPNFLTGSNFMNILRAVALLGIASCGMAFVVYNGNLADLAIPSYMAFSGIITVAMLPWGLVPAIILGLLAGMLIGALNGLVIGKLDANPILWTLAVAYFMEGFMRFAWSNSQLYPDQILETSGKDTAIAEHFIAIFRTDIGPVPLIVVVMIAMFLILQFVFTRTKFGLQTKLVGSSREVARSTGVNVTKVILLNFIVTALCASIGGIFITSMNKLGVFYLGQGYDFKAVTAVVLGGMMQSGGKGSMLGVFGGVLVIGLMTNILTFMGVNTFQQNIVTGSIFILVVGIHQYQLRKQGKDYA